MQNQSKNPEDIDHFLKSQPAPERKLKAKTSKSEHNPSTLNPQ
jgi:hypothetical protein